MVGIHLVAIAARTAATFLVVALAATAVAKDQTMDEIFRRAVQQAGQDYVDAERELLQGGAAAVVTLRAQLTGNRDPLARLVAECVLDQIEGRKPEYAEAMAYIDGLPLKLARTPITSPSPTGIASYLTKHYGDRVAPYLALRLVKGTDWPRWKVNGVLFYLRDQRVPATSFPLLRFAVETGVDEWRGTAVEALRNIEDPGLRAKIEAERQRLQRERRTLPEPIAELEASAPSS